MDTKYISISSERDYEELYAFGLILFNEILGMEIPPLNIYSDNKTKGIFDRSLGGGVLTNH